MSDLEHIVILKDPTMYYIVPWLTRLQNGELILTVRESHRRRVETICHVDVTARSVMLRSSDDGRNWSIKTVVDDETYRFSQTEDTPVTQLSDGTLLVNLYSWAITPLPPGFPLRCADSESFVPLERPFTFTFEGSWLVRSTDNGRTWSARTPLAVEGLPRLSARVPVLEMPDGSLLLAVCAAVEPGSRIITSWVIRSTDQGATWEEHAVMAQDPDKVMGFVEPCMLRCSNGEFIAMLRPGDAGEHNGYLFQTNSTDDGRTWSEPVRTRMWGYPAHLLELRDGRVLCTYGHRREPFGVRACVSADGGRSWDIENEIVLRDDGGCMDLGYPSAVEFDDGRVLVAYWFNQWQPGGDRASEVRYVAGSFFRP